jgi:hypothetical protein
VNAWFNQISRRPRSAVLPRLQSARPEATGGLARGTNAARIAVPNVPAGGTIAMLPMRLTWLGAFMPTTDLAVQHQSAESMLMNTVNGMRPFVSYRLNQRPNDVDVVLQRVRETIWRRSSAFDPDRGRPEDWGFGITRNVVRRELQRRVRDDVSLVDETMPALEPDPLSRLVTQFDSRRWMRLVTEFVGDEDWRLVTALAADGANVSSVASRHGVGVRRLRTARERVALTAATVRAALTAADAGRKATVVVAAECLPERAGLRSPLPYLGTDSELVAKELAIHPGTARARIAAGGQVNTRSSRDMWDTVERAAIHAAPPLAAEYVSASWRALSSGRSKSNCVQLCQTP